MPPRKSARSRSWLWPMLTSATTLCSLRRAGRSRPGIQPLPRRHKSPPSHPLQELQTPLTSPPHSHILIRRGTAGRAAAVPPGLDQAARQPPLWRHRHPQGTKYRHRLLVQHSTAASAGAARVKVLVPHAWSCPALLPRQAGLALAPPWSCRTWPPRSTLRRRCEQLPSSCPPRGHQSSGALPARCRAAQPRTLLHRSRHATFQTQQPAVSRCCRPLSRPCTFFDLPTILSRLHFGTPASINVFPHDHHRTHPALPPLQLPFRAS